MDQILGPFTLIDPLCRGYLAPTLLTCLTRNCVCTRMKSAWPVFNRVVIFCRCLYPPCQDAFGSLKSFEPLKAMVICPQDNLGPKKVVATVLKSHHDSKKFTTSGAIIPLCPIKNMRIESYGPFDTIDNLTEDSANSNIRSIGIKDAWNIGMWICQRSSIQQRTLQLIK